MRNTVRWVFVSAFVASLAVSWTSPSLAQQGIGSASSIRNQVTGAVSGATSAIAVGGNVYQNEIVRTGDDALARLVFLDETNLSVGPRSEVTLDRFVYNPARSAGSVVVRTGQGVFRFVTGSQRPQNYRIETPIATIGVRGTVFDLAVESDRLVIFLRSGHLRITTTQGRVILLGPGGTLTVFANGTFSRQAVWAGGTPVDFADLFGPAPVQLAHGGEPVPLPTGETKLAMWRGGFVGAQVVGSWSDVHTTEFSRLTGLETNSFTDDGHGFGGGINGGYNWAPWNDDVIVGVVFDANFLNDRAPHVFAGGTFITSTVDFTASAQARVGRLVTPTTLLYVQTGVSVANQRLQINFGGEPTDESQLTPGYTAGFGGEFMLPGILPSNMTLFANYQHTWWGAAELDAPAASPLSNFTWSRQSDVIEAGLRFRFDSAPPAVPLLTK